MKKIILKSLLGITILVSSCKKEEIYNLNPDETFTSDLVFSTPERMDAAMVGTYNRLQSAEFLSGRALVYVDILGEDIYDRQGFFGDLPRFNLSAANGTSSAVWSSAYLAIGEANRCIEGVTKYSSIVAPEVASAYIAEGKFVRSVANFYLVNFFAQPYVFSTGATHTGIPLMTKSYTSPASANIPRSTVAEVYDNMIKDLKEAIVDLPTAYGDNYSTKTRATKAAAAALLARIYLYKEDFINAKKYSGDLIAGLYGSYSLGSTVNAAFGSAAKNQTPETVWSIPNSATDNPNTNNSLPQHYGATGRADFPISSTFLNVATNPYFAVDDKRRTLMIVSGSGALSTKKFTNKYPQVGTSADFAPVLRYAEVLLTYAEASVKDSKTIDADAISKLNLVRNRAKATTTPAYTPASFTTYQELIDAILGERRIELAFEGHRFWDLMRNKKNVTNKMDSDGTTVLNTQNFGDNHSILAIPQREIDLSKGVLKQNPGY